MKKIKTTTKFRRDIKRFERQSEKIEKMRKVVEIIAQGQILPQQYKPHIL